MFLVYNLLITILAPIWVPWMWIRTRARKLQPNWPERFGNYDIERRKDRKRVWFHAVSVGEVVAALPILAEVRAVLPDHEIILSTTTSSGYSTAQEKAKGYADRVFYFPIDIARFQLAAVQRVQPSVVAIMETELWFNFLWAAKVFDCRTMLINGRISDRSFKRSVWVKFFYKSLLRNMDRCLMQSAEDASRIEQLGGQHVSVEGNCKFDQAAANASADPAVWKQELGLNGSRVTLVVGSTRGAEEEDFVIGALSADQQLVFAPRHLERAEELLKKLQAKFGQVARRSKGEKGQVVLLDSYGELDSVYCVADIVVIGGGFANHGGQNLIQPLALGKPVLHGRWMQNFRDVTEMALRSGASLRCETQEQLRAAIQELRQDEVKRLSMGEAAAELIRANVGASRRYAEAIADEANQFTAK